MRIDAVATDDSNDRQFLATATMSATSSVWNVAIQGKSVAVAALY